MLRRSEEVERFFRGRAGVPGGVVTGTVSTGTNFSVLAVGASASLRLLWWIVLVCLHAAHGLRAASDRWKVVFMGAISGRPTLREKEEWRDILRETLEKQMKMRRSAGQGNQQTSSKYQLPHVLPLIGLSRLILCVASASSRALQQHRSDVDDATQFLHAVTACETDASCAACGVHRELKSPRMPRRSASLLSLLPLVELVELQKCLDWEGEPMGIPRRAQGAVAVVLRHQSGLRSAVRCSTMATSTESGTIGSAGEVRGYKVEVSQVGRCSCSQLLSARAHPRPLHFA